MIKKKVTYLSIASKDLSNAKRNFVPEDFSLCARLCQQTAEKSLKYFIQQFGSQSDETILRSHKIQYLYRRACELGLEVFDNDKVCKLGLLSDFYFDTNYPTSDYYEVEEEEAAEALKLAERVYDLVCSRFLPKLDLF